MSYNASAYLAYEEHRHLNPEQPLGVWSGRATNHNKPVANNATMIHTMSVSDHELANETETERYAREDAWLAANGII